MADRQRSRFWLWYWLAISTGYAIAALGYAQHAADAANHQIRDLQIQVDKLNKYIEQHKQHKQPSWTAQAQGWRCSVDSALIEQPSRKDKDMNVELLSYTPDALNLLLRTKGTRLAHTSDPSTWTDEQKQEHLDYMRDTIKSSWEFVDYTFRITGVTRAFTHQLVRTRTGSYAQEAMRVIDASDHPVDCPEKIVREGGDVLAIWNDGVSQVMGAYQELLQQGVAAQDARGLLPTNITTSIIAKFNLRTLHESAKLRLCTRTQGEYQNVFRLMRARVIEVHPWAEEFIQVYCAYHGTCAFPRFGKAECPIYKHVLPVEQLEKMRPAIKQAWEEQRYEASPRAKDGKAM